MSLGRVVQHIAGQTTSVGHNTSAATAAYLNGAGARSQELTGVDLDLLIALGIRIHPSPNNIRAARVRTA